jgi:hypothetical protein
MAQRAAVHYEAAAGPTAREEVGGHEVAAGAVAEVVEHAVAVRLQHLGVDVEARVPHRQGPVYSQDTL